MTVPVAQASGAVNSVSLRIVNSYRHLGALILSNGNLTPEAIARSQSAMRAFVPLAGKVFASRAISLSLRIALAWSLVMTRLLYNVQNWSKFDGKPRHVLNTAYNRVWRAIAFCPRYAAGGQTDVEVRRLLGVPSIDCVARSHRLRYLARLSDVSFPALNVLLQQRVSSGARLPWVKLILSDLLVLRQAVAPKLDSLPDPHADATPWWSLMLNFRSEWKAIVASYFSLLDDHVQTLPVQMPAALSFACSVCSCTFRSAKALGQHSRVKHGLRSLPAACLPDISVCPFCSTEFHDRYFLVTHLSDMRVRSKVRGTSCGILFAESCPTPLPAEQSARLNEKARVLRKRAGSAGLSRPLALAPALAGKRKVSAGIPAHLLRQLRPDGVRRRISAKMRPAFALLRFAPRKPCCSDRSHPQVPRRRLRMKTSLQQVLQDRPLCGHKRLQVKTPSATSTYGAGGTCTS